MRKLNVLVVVIVSIFLLSGCTKEIVFDDLELEAEKILKSSNGIEQIKFLDKIEFENGCSLLFKQNEDIYSFVSFKKLTNNNFVKNLVTISHVDSVNNLTEGSLFENGYFTYHLFGLVPDENKDSKKLIVEFRNNDNRLINSDEVDVNSENQVFYSFQISSAEKMNVKYSFQK